MRLADVVKFCERVASCFFSRTSASNCVIVYEFCVWDKHHQGYPKYIWTYLRQGERLKVLLRIVLP